MLDRLLIASYGQDVNARDPALLRRLADVVEATLTRYHRAQVRGLEHIPAGGALYVGNHNSVYYTPDTFIFCVAALREHGLDAVPHGLAHEVPMRLPLIGQLLERMGAVRASHRNGEALLSQGRKVLVYPGGDVDACRPYRARNRIVFDGRRGYVRLALRAGVPIVPVVAAGAHSTLVVVDDLRWLSRLLGFDTGLRMKVWPLCLSIPWGATIGPPPVFIPWPARIIVEALEPVAFSRGGPSAANDVGYVGECAARVEAAMQDALTRLSGEVER